MSTQSYKRSLFRSLSNDSEDGNGMRQAQQCRFAVCYKGETAWQDDFTHVQEVMKNILPKQMSGKFWPKKEAKQKVWLFVDVCFKSMFIQNSEGNSESCFKFCNIKEVIYCENMKQYSKYIILVANEEADSVVKAHIFACSTVKEAKSAFKFISDVFTRASYDTQDFSLQARTDHTDVFTDEITCSPHLSLATSVKAEIHDSISEESEEQTSPEFDDFSVEKAFTSFARSRSFNSGKHYTQCARTKYLRHYSLPAY